MCHLTDHTLHIQAGIVRTDTGSITLDQLRRSDADADADADITIRPVLDPAALAPVDSYEIPLPMRRAIQLRHPHTVVPDGTKGPTDLDHTTAYRTTGTPGQTRLGNLGPLTRAERRAKTVARSQSRQPDPGTYLWRSPHGWIALTTNQGTLMLGTLLTPDNSGDQQPAWKGTPPEPLVGPAIGSTAFRKLARIDFPR